MEYIKYYTSGEVHYSQGDFGKALACFERALAYNKTNDCMNYIGCCHIGLGNFEEAKKLFEGMTKNVCWQNPWFHLGRIYLHEEDYAKAEQCFDMALDLCPDDEDANFYLGRYYETLGQFEQAIAFYKTSLRFAEDFKDTWGTHLNLGMCYKALEQYDEAMYHFDMAYTIDEQCPEAVYDKAIVYILKKQYAIALRLLKQAELLGMAEDEVKEDIAYCLLNIDSTQEDMAGFYINFDMGESFYHKKMYGQAITYFKKAHELKWDARCVDYMSSCYIALGALKEAETLALEIKDMQWEGPWLNLGRIYLIEERYQEAEQCFMHALNLNPKKPDCYFYLGTYYQQLQNPTLAIENYRKSIALETSRKETGIVYFNLGMCHQTQNALKQALECFVLAYEADESLLQALYQQAKVAIKMQQYEKALQLLREVQEKGMNDSRVIQNIRHCEKRIGGKT